jgi:hypothetical protein
MAWPIKQGGAKEARAASNAAAMARAKGFSGMLQKEVCWKGSDYRFRHLLGYDASDSSALEA